MKDTITYGSQKGRVMVVDDEEVMRDSCAKALSKVGYMVETVADGDSAIKRFGEFLPDVVLVDLKMPGKDGIDVIKDLERLDPTVVRVVITGYATAALAVEAMKKGAYDFLSKPLTPDEIRIVVNRAMERRRLILEKEAMMREQERIRKNMMSLVSHELRAPLAATVQYLEVILAGMSGEVSDEARELIHRCNSRLHEMLELFSRWLNMATFDKDKIVEEFSEVAVEEIAQDVIMTMRPMAEEHQVDLSLETADHLPRILGSRPCIEEIVNNLVSNGIKYNKPEGWVKLQIYQDKEGLSVEVSDNGQGIPPEHLPRIFDEFYRVDGRRNAPVKGSGLGLAIAKKMVEAHGGSISVSSEQGKGSVFKVTFPLDHRMPEGQGGEKLDEK
ncbi:MAG: hybrid sensor histidine kinase/response regulator [Deltaproteobacteria bacterium]|nr:hybrid sensor histidine kinase/response regulator [Deltaproteobacteria bacterium]MBW2081953.1 hybrid sensor histidine kinase/response regulator [Deltaproteobacteria bacterium]